MRVHRSAPTGDVTQLPIAMIQDERLTFFARGLLIELLTGDDTQDLNSEEICQRARKGRGSRAEGRRAIRAALAELEQLGYLVRRRVQDTNGRFITLTEVYDVPHPSTSTVEPDPAPWWCVPGPDPEPCVPYQETVSLYRHWDADGVLLYVGITAKLKVRERQHEATSRWWGLRAETTLEEYPSRAAAEAAEALAIKTERPLFNVAGNDDPDVLERRRRYLAARGRLELLTPSTYIEATASFLPLIPR